MFTILNAPGPTFSRSSVVGWLKHGQPLPESIGCALSTANGAAYFAEPRFQARAVASAPTLTEEIPSTFERKPGATRSALTEIVSFGNVFELNWICVMPPPFLSPYSCASACASDSRQRKLLRACERGRVGDRLRRPVSPEPRADVHDERSHGAERHDRDGHDGEHLAAFGPCLQSSWSFHTLRCARVEVAASARRAR